MNVNHVQMCSDASIISLLSRTVVTFTEKSMQQQTWQAPILLKDTYVSYDLAKLIHSARYLGYIISSQASVAELWLYQQIVEMMKPLKLKEQKILTAIVERKVGSLPLLASRITEANISWLMDKFKLSNTIPLLYKFATSPSVMGKIVALWQFLEMHGVLWQQFPWEKIQSLLTTCYHALSWIMQKTRMLHDLAQQGVQWVSAHVFSTEADQQIPIPINAERFDLKGNKLEANLSIDTSGIPESQAEKDFVETPPTEPITPVEEPIVTIENNIVSILINKPIYLRAECYTCCSPAFFGCTRCRAHACQSCFAGSNWCACEVPEVHTINVCTCRQTLVATPDFEKTNAVCGKLVDVCLDSTSTSASTTPERCESPPPGPSRKVDLASTIPKLATQEIVADKEEAKTFIENLKLETLGDQILNWIEETFCSVVNFFEKYPLFSGILTLASTLCTFFGATLPFFCGGAETTQFMNKVSNSLRCSYYAQRGTDGIFSACKGLIDTTKTIFGISTDANIIAFKKRLVETNEMADKMLGVAMTNSGQFINDSQKYGEFRQQMDAIYKIYKDLSTVPNSQAMQQVTPIWNMLNQTFNKITQLFQKYTSGISERQIPVCVYLWGRSDIGKSTYLSYLADELNHRTERSMQVFTISKGPEYWNNYCQQDILKIDDFSAWIGPEGNTDALAVFNLITPAAYNPNMASLIDKNIMATPKFVFIAANVPTIPLNTGVTDIEAFERRRHIFVKVEWPEHEASCQPGERDCDHWKKMKEKNKEELVDFSNLTFKLCNPLVTRENCRSITNFSRDKARRQIVNQRTIIPDEDIVADGVYISSEELINKCIEIEADHKRTFMQTMERKKKSGSLLQSIQQDWQSNNTIILGGPPGIGKTTIVERYVAKLPKDVLRVEIKTMDDFNAFVKQGCVTTMTSIVIFHDFSAYINSEYIAEFLDKMKERHDIKTIANLWIIAANMNILEEKLFEIYKTPEAVSYCLRRVEVIQFTFNSYLTWKGYKSYTCEDIKKATNGIEHMVKRTYQGDDYSTEQLIVLLTNFKPTIIKKEMHDDLVVYSTYNPNTIVSIDLSIKEFIELCNNSHPIMVAAALVKGNTKFSSKVATFQEMAQKLYTAVRRSGANTGTVLNLDAMLVEAWNAGHLDVFKGDQVMFSFTDATYVIDTNPEIIVGKVDVGTDEIDGTIAQLAKCSYELSAFDFLNFGSSILSPWFCLVGDMLMTITKILGTGLICASAVMAESKSQKAISLFDKMEEVTTRYTDQEMSAIPNKMTEALLYPGLANGARSPQVAYVDQDNPFEFKPETAGNIRVKPKRETPGNIRVKPNIPNRQYTDHNVIVPSRHMPHVEFKDEVIVKNTVVTQAETLQVATDPSIPTVINAIAANLVEILSENNVRVCFGVMVRERLGTTVSHITDIGKNFYAKTIDGRKYSISTVAMHSSIDRLDFEITDKTCPAFRDITHHFSDRNAPPSYKTHGVLLNMSHDVSEKFPTLKMRSYMVNGMTIVKFNNNNTQFYHIKYLGHRAGTVMTGVQTHAGDCGSLLMIADPSWQTGKIIGMHVGAGTNVAYARLLLKEHYVDETVTQAIMPSMAIDPEFVSPVERNDSNVIGITKKKQHVPARTKLFRNLVPIGEKKFEPAILSSKDTRNPGVPILIQETNRWIGPTVEFDSKRRERFMQIAVGLADWYADKLSKDDTTLSVLTRMQALNKLSGCSKSEPINVTTSPGFPYTDVVKHPGKKDFIRVDENGIHRFKQDSPFMPMLKKRMDMYSNELHGRGEASCIFKIFLKDEPIKLKKIYDVAQTRTIAAAPLDYQIVFRQYLHSAMAHVNEHFNDVPVKIGINPQSLDWHTLFHSLAAKSTLALDIDFTGWDFSPHPFYVEPEAAFWNRLYQRLDPNWSKADDEMRNILYSKMCCFNMLVGCTVKKADKGQGSGYPGTSNDNSKINEFNQIYVYYEIMERNNHPELCNIASFFEDVEMAVYGDDLLMTFSDFYRKLVNLEEYADILRSLGFSPTSADKSGPLKFKPLIECQFMSRGFRQYHQFVLGPLNLDRLFKTTWWVHGKKQRNYCEEPDLAIQDADNVANAYLSVLHEAVLHGVDTYNICRQAAVEARNICGHQEYIPFYEELLSRMFGINDLLTPNYVGVTTHKEHNILITNPVHIREPAVVHAFQNRRAFHFGPGYTYNHAVHPGTIIPQNLLPILQHLNSKYKRNWNSVLVNVYQKYGGIPWHKDDEACVDQDQGVGCLTIKGCGLMQFRHDNGEAFQFNTSTGDFYIIEKENLLNWKHRRTQHYDETVSLTFRTIV
uniref:Polyprotein n=1 Tax=Picornavirales sp. TaxID=1955153 RepID=A0A6M3YNZ8_9VIRU|nr:MAG: hypothetical protein 1 [Picornavirales sp.]